MSILNILSNKKVADFVTLLLNPADLINYAIKENDTKLFEEVIKLYPKIDMNKPDQHDITILMNAAQYGRSSILVHLLKMGALVDDKKNPHLHVV